MESCSEDTVERDQGDANEETSRKYILRQILVCSGIWLSSFCNGLNYGSPTVFIVQIRREANSTDAVSVEMASWLSSTYNYSGMASVAILAFLAKLIGRKFCFIIICITTVFAYTFFYFSTNITQILVSEIMQGPLMASPITISTMVLTEYVSPRYRGVFLTLKSAIMLWGIWVANAIGTFLPWKNIIILALVCSIYSLLTALFWPESPYWLAGKRRFKDCEASHRWLKGRSKDSEDELENLIKSRNNFPCVQTKTTKFHKKIIIMFSSKSFYKPLLLSFLVMSLYHFSGKTACAMYSIDIIMRITGIESTAYIGMLILDGITILGMYIGCGLSRNLKRRTLLLVSSTIGVTFLFCISFYLYLVQYEIIPENTIVSMSLLMGYSLSISVGPMIMSTTILGELVPVKYRSSSLLLIGFFGHFLMGCILKISPFVLTDLGARGLFLFFAFTESLFMIVNYKLLPETKDKTILEIQEALLNKESNSESIHCPKHANRRHLNF